MSMMKKILVGWIGFMTILGMTACGNTPPAVVADSEFVPQISAYDLTATALCIVNTDEARRELFGYKLYGSPTPDPLRTPTPTPQYVVNLTGDPRNGETLFHGDADCALCHSVTDDETIIGPSLQFIAGRAGYMRPNMSADDYLTGAILYPEYYIPTRGRAGIMPTTYQQLFTPQEIADVVAYLLTLQ